MEQFRLAKPFFARFALVCMLLFSSILAEAQQFNSDSWLSKPHGTITLIPTFGERSTMLMNTYSLFPRWEFTIAAYLYHDDHDPLTDDGHSTSFYGKYMFYQNKDSTGGAAVKAGTGMFPGNIDGEHRTNDAFQTYWTNFPCTIPFFNNKLSWDLMPGASVTRHFEETKSSTWAFTYSTRIAWNPFSPLTSIVGELYGSAGKLKSNPEYKIGLRWEPSRYGVFAITYGDEFGSNKGAGFEFGVMLFTPPFACLGGCDPKKKNKIRFY